VVLLANFTASGRGLIELGYDLLALPPSGDTQPRGRP
jgi:hypothetical protein